jgi:DNA mismatch repair protein MSH4
MLKSFVQSVGPLSDALAGARSEMLVRIRENCRPEVINRTINLIHQVINEDVTYQKSPLDLRNQRTYAVKVVKILPACEEVLIICSLVSVACLT